MGNTTSSSGSIKTNTNCKTGNTCSQSGRYFGFGKHDTTRYYKNKVVYKDANGRFTRVKNGSRLSKVYLPKGARVTSVKTEKKKSSPKKRVLQQERVIKKERVLQKERVLNLALET